MSTTAKRLTSSLALCGAGFAAALLVLYPLDAADPKPKPLESQVLGIHDAPSFDADWGKMHTYFRGETFSTKDMLTAVAVVEPGKAVHRSHRHPHEEYLVVVRGSGTWSLDGKEIPAKQGDVMYVRPWVYHGLTNTGSERLGFLVIRYNGKGVEPPPRPDDEPDEL